MAAGKGEWEGWRWWVDFWLKRDRQRQEGGGEGVLIPGVLEIDS